MRVKNKLSARQFRDKITPAMKYAFFGAFLSGFFAHLFAFTNIIPNPDGLSRVFDEQQMTISGRWFLHYATAWNGYVQAPAVIGFFSLLFLAISSAIAVELFQVKSPMIAACCGVLMSVFPSVAYTFLYMFTASAYFFGLLLAVIAVFLAARRRFGFLYGAILLACGIGTYQAYLASAASLCLIYAILFGLSGKHSAKEILLTALKLLAFLVIGLALYFGFLKVFLWAKKLTLLDYKGISSLGKDLSIRGVFELVFQTYKKFAQYFLNNHFAQYTTPVAVAANALFFAVGVWAFFTVVSANRCAKKPAAFLLTLFLCLLLPLALNLTVMMGDAMPIMRYALVFAYVFLLVLADRAAAAKEPSKPKKKMPSALRIAALCVSAMLAVISFNIDNLCYTVSAQAHRATESFAARLVERVETTPGYRSDMQVVVIGCFPKSVYYNEIEAFSVVEDYSNPSSSVMPLNKHIYYYLNDWLNVPWVEPDEETMQAVSDSEAFQAMPLYPNDGCIQIIDGRVIVKLASKYTPKKPHEIAYENRR